MTGWRDRAACRDKDPDLFYPETPGQLVAARAACRGCPVRVRCLDDAISNGDDFAVRGGLTAAERRPISTGDKLADVLARADQAAADPRSIGELIGDLVHIIAAAVAAAEAPPIPPDPEAAEHCAILLRELDAYDETHGRGRGPDHRWAFHPSVVGGRRQRPVRLTGDDRMGMLRDARNEAGRLRRVGRPVPGPLADLEREYGRLAKQDRRRRAGGRRAA